jgi:pyruvate dehydrogenase E2 component (dihydrolipoamide acetyltransferase)
MRTEFAMPKLGHLMDEGKVALWRKQPGDRLAKGDVLLEVETDKAVVEVESPVSGTLAQILVGDGVTVPVGAALAVIDAA